MKKFITILALSLAAMATFSGCQKKESSTNPPPPDKPMPTNAPASQ